MPIARAEQQLGQLLGRELSRLYGDPPQVLFHYTTREATAAITSSGFFKASNIGRLSDFTETRYAAAIMGACIDLAFGSETDSEAIELFDAMRRQFKSITFDSVFVVSLTTQSNDPGMWNLYSGRGTGCALEFDVEELDRWGRPLHSGLLLKCHYGEPKVTFTCCRILDYMRTIYLSERKQGCADFISDYIQMFFSNVRWLAPMFKPEIFEDEHEWRLVF